MRGLIDTAEHAGAQLLCFVGGQLPGSADSEAGRHRVYDLCSSRNVDGVVALSSTLIHGAGPGALERRAAQLRPLPLCSIGVRLGAFPSVTVDNEVGVERLLDHAIREHGARRVAFVRGPIANAEAELRFRAYRRALAQHDLPFDERLVAVGNFMAESGSDAVRALRAVPGLALRELDAIVASNDAMAMGVLAELEREQIAVPTDVAVLGFDDIEDARLTQPPLTTVRQPLERLGQEALRVTLDWIRHGAPPAAVELATEPVVRRSCGCALPSGRAGPSLGPERSLGFEAALLMKRERILLELTRVAQGSFSAGGRDWADRLVNALAADLRNPEPSGFVSVFDTLLERLLARGVDLNLCDQVLGALRAQVVPLLRSDRARSERAEDLFHVCRLATSQATQRGLMRERLHVSRWNRELNATCLALASSASVEELAAKTLSLLPCLDIRACTVALHDGSGAARLLFGYDASGPLARSDAAFEASSLVPGGLATGAERGSFVVLPLVFRERNLGHVLLDLDLRHAFAYGGIAEALGIGLNGCADR